MQLKKSAFIIETDSLFKIEYLECGVAPWLVRKQILFSLGFARYDCDIVEIAMALVDNQQ